MQDPSSLRASIEELRAKYAGTSFVARLEEADTLDTIDAASAFFIRDTKEVANIVWLAGGVIYDATWFPASDDDPLSGQSTLNILPLSEVAAFEVRESPDVVRQLHGSVGGDLLIRALADNRSATLYWGASSGEEADALREFFAELFRTYVSSMRDAAT